MDALSIESLTSNPDSAPFWQAAQQQRFVVQRCADCGKARFLPRPVCPFCGSLKSQWENDAGLGTIYSMTTVFRPVYDDGPPPPYQVAIAEMDAGITFLARAATSVNLDVGDRVQVSFETSGGLVLPAFDLQRLSNGRRASEYDKETTEHG